MLFDEVKNLEHASDFIFGIAVGYMGSLLHSSLIYKYDGKLLVIDFIKQSIRDSYTIGDLGYNDYVYVKYNRDAIFDALALQVPSICELIKENKTSIDFGIKYTDTKFNEKGELIYAAGDFGLTCSTFILSILNSVSIKLIDIENWKERSEDKEWQKNILGFYEEKSKENPKQYENLLSHYKNNLGCFRFNPIDIAVASSCDVLPAGIDYCDLHRERIFEFMNY